MSNYMLYPPTPSFLGVRIKTKGGLADIQVRTLKTTWKYVDKNACEGLNNYVFTLVEEAYRAGFSDGVRQPNAAKQLVQDGEIEVEDIVLKREPECTT